MAVLSSSTLRSPYLAAVGAQCAPFACHVAGGSEEEARRIREAVQFGLVHKGLGRRSRRLDDAPHGQPGQNLGRAGEHHEGQFRALRIGTQPSAKDDDKPWDPSYTNLRKLPHEWLWGCLCQLENCAINPALAAQMKTQDSKVLWKLLDYALGLPDSTPLPKLCLDKLICGAVFRKLYIAMGARLDKAFKAKIKPDGSIDWKVCGPYDFATPNSIKHRPSGKVGLGSTLRWGVISGIGCGALLDCRCLFVGMPSPHIRMHRAIC